MTSKAGRNHEEIIKLLTELLAELKLANRKKFKPPVRTKNFRK